MNDSSNRSLSKDVYAQYKHIRNNLKSYLQLLGYNTYPNHVPKIDYQDEIEELPQDEQHDAIYELLQQYEIDCSFIPASRWHTPPFYQYLITTGGPQIEIDFFVDFAGSKETYRIEFKYIDARRCEILNITQEQYAQDLWEFIVNG